MREPRSLAWTDPIKAFQAVCHEQEGPVAFLHSSLSTSYSGRYSWLAWGSAAFLTSNEWESLRGFLPDQESLPAFGFLSYEMLAEPSETVSTAPAYIKAPCCQFFLPKQLMCFDHLHRTVKAWGERAEVLDAHRMNASFVPLPRVAHLSSNMNKEEYLQKALATMEAIREGDFYQANLTRKFFGQFESVPDPSSLFLGLVKASPAPYSAYLQFGDLHVLSSSPEQFLRLSSQGRLETRPIKGTIRRHPGGEAAEREQLQASTKDRAENLMIVDLMRNDLAKVCQPSSVEADKLFEVDSFSTLHHLSSTVSGQLAPGKDALDAVRAAFPPGSMTGAPKIAAMRWCRHMEGMERGIYSGALGWMTRHSLELSVVIRTLLLKGNIFEFQVGGGIVADSIPENEWRETISKAQGLCQALGMEESLLENL